MWNLECIARDLVRAPGRPAPEGGVGPRGPRRVIGRRKARAACGPRSAALEVARGREASAGLRSAALEVSAGCGPRAVAKRWRGPVRPRSR
jgi:hypothetical protein